MISYETERGRRFRYAGAASIVLWSWSVFVVSAEVGPAILAIYGLTRHLTVLDDPMLILLAVIVMDAAVAAGFYCGVLAVRFWRQIKEAAIGWRGFRP